jgi:hypothetical protein
MQPLLLEGGQAGSQEGFRFTSFFSSNFDSNLQARLTNLGRLSFSSTSALLAGPPRRQAASAESFRSVSSLAANASLQLDPDVHVQGKTQ